MSGPTGMNQSSAVLSEASGGAASLSSPSISQSRPCPFLGSRKGQSTPFERPSKGNVCFAQSRMKFKYFRRVSVPYTAVSRKIQTDLCMGSFDDCSIHNEYSLQLTDKAASDFTSETGQLAGIEQTSTSHHPTQKRTRKKRASHGFSYHALSKRGKTTVQAGAAFTACIIAAMGLSLLMSARPSSFIEYIFMTVMRNDIKSFGMKHLGIKDKFGSSGGLVTGGNLRSLKTMSSSTQQKLKKSKAFKNMSRAQKERLRKQFSGK